MGLIVSVKISRFGHDMTADHITIRVQYPLNTNLATSPKSFKLKLQNLHSDDDLLAQHIKD